MTYYDLFGVPPYASADDIKKAFRREIAKYHPDKVQHLGREFQDIAVTKAAELTQAYKTLSDPAARADYDAMLEEQGDAPASRGASAPPPSAAPRPASEKAARPAQRKWQPPPEAASGAGVFSEERAGAMDLVRRATFARFRKALETEFGRCDASPVAGFDITCVPEKQGFFGRVPPQIFARFLPQVDGPAVTETWSLAVKGRKDTQRDVCVFVMAPSLSSAGELAMAIADQRRKPIPGGGKLVMIPVNTKTWNAHVPTDAPPVVKSLLTRLKSA